jgi:hypothetical protein
MGVLAACERTQPPHLRIDPLHQTKPPDAVRCETTGADRLLPTAPGRQRTTPRHRSEFPADRMCPVHAIHPVSYPLDARVESLQLFVQLGEGVSGHTWSTLTSITVMN